METQQSRLNGSLNKYLLTMPGIKKLIAILSTGTLKLQESQTASPVAMEQRLPTR